MKTNNLIKKIIGLVLVFALLLTLLPSVSFARSSNRRAKTNTSRNIRPKKNNSNKFIPYRKNSYKNNNIIAAGIVKKSMRNICHAPYSTYYEMTKHFTSYKTIENCLNSGGRLPLR